ncbi:MULTISPECIES: DUF4157 domain-containing protein [unclassified Streptomyces]|uniref:eCIS core domain-containing protein n=1 Tax=unclassified Streptomyces TaxID=2593676 RepID=UPI000F740DEF|nr:MULTISPECIES: DUF4157 domain-containing protein [unclassified Streptomyces]
MRTQRESDPGRLPDGPARRPAATGVPQAVQRAAAASGALTPGQVTALQGAAGNAAVVQRLAGSGDQHGSGCAPGCGHGPSVQRRGAGTPVQRRVAAHDVLSTPGRPFSGPLRDEAEGVYGMDLGHVRVHTGPQAKASSEEMGAEAWTSGNHMVFKGTPKREEVMHEVAHTIQQMAGPVSGNDHGDGLRISDPNSPEERQAAAMENATAPTPGVQRLISSVTGHDHSEDEC